MPRHTSSQATCRPAAVVGHLSLAHPANESFWEIEAPESVRGLWGNGQEHGSYKYNILEYTRIGCLFTGVIIHGVGLASGIGAERNYSRQAFPTKGA